LKSPNHVVLDGALLGLLASNHVPHEAFAVIVRRLYDPDVQLRRTAAQAMSEFSRFASESIPILMERLRDETDPETLNEIALALVEAGPPAIEPLLQALLKGKVQESDNAANALVTIGEDAARAIAEYFPNITSALDLQKLLIVLEGMGRESAPAIPTFTNILDHLENEFTALHVIRMFYFCGPPALCAVPAVIRYAARQGTANEELNDWIIRVLGANVPQTVELLRAAISYSMPDASARLQTLLARLDSPQANPFASLSGFPDPVSVERYVALAETLSAQGACSMRELARRLNKAYGTGKDNYTGWSAASLERALKTVEKHTGKTLVARGKRRGASLTEDGKAFLRDCKDFLKRTRNP
jgi:hypothetical protein